MAKHNPLATRIACDHLGAGRGRAYPALGTGTDGSVPG